LLIQCKVFSLTGADANLTVSVEREPEELSLKLYTFYSGQRHSDPSAASLQTVRFPAGEILTQTSEGEVQAWAKYSENQG